MKRDAGLVGSCAPVVGAAVFLLLWPGSLAAQDGGKFERTLEQYGEETVVGYVKPMADLLGANINSGFAIGARIPRMRPSFHLEIVAMGAMVRDAQKVYIASTPPGFSPEQAETATIFGGTGTLVTSDVDPALQYRFSDGLLTADLVPFAAPQLRVGGILGTEAVVRFAMIPQDGEGDRPEARLLGIGVRHSISQYLPLLPVDIAAGVFYNSLTVGEYVDLDALSFGAHASRSIPFLTVYGGASWERTTLRLSYSGEEGEVDVEMQGSNTARMTGGVVLRLGIVSIFGDASLGNVTNFTGGIRFGI